jgi:ABC-type sulfate transport system permease component
MLLGTALVVWILSGWAIFFQTAPRRPVISALGTIMFASALAAAVAVLAGLYLAALGPSWIL